MTCLHSSLVLRRVWRMAKNHLTTPAPYRRVLFFSGPSLAWQHSCIRRCDHRCLSKCSCWFMDDANVVKVMTLGFNELWVMCICWGEVTDVVILAISSSVPTAHNNHAKGEEGVEMMRCRAQCSFRLLLTVTRTAVFAAPPPYLGNDHLPSKGPRASHYPPSRRRWRAEDKVTGAGLSDVPHLSPGGWLGAPVLTDNPQSKEKYLGLFSAKRWDYVFLPGKVTYLLNEVLL